MTITKTHANEIRKQYRHITDYEIRNSFETHKTERGAVAALAKINAAREAKANEPLPVSISITVDWSKNRYWGANPTVSIAWTDAAGEWHNVEKCGHASGCGYDKHSSAVAAALNNCFYNLLWSARRKNMKNKPYGIGNYGGRLWFEGGVGMGCYYRVFEWLGYTLEHAADRQNFDLWRVTKKRAKR